MNWNKFLIVIIVILAGFMIVNIFMTFRARTSYTQVNYRAVYSYDYDGSVRTFTTARLVFDKYEDMLKVRDGINSESLDKKMDYYQKAVARIASNLDRTMRVVSFNSSATIVSGMLEISETSEIENFAAVDENGVVDTSLGSNKIQLRGEASVIVEVPQDAQILSVYPTPTEVTDNKFVWKGIGEIVFPKVRFTKK